MNVENMNVKNGQIWIEVGSAWEFINADDFAEQTRLKKEFNERETSKFYEPGEITLETIKQEMINCCRKMHDISVFACQLDRGTIKTMQIGGENFEWMAGNQYELDFVQQFMDKIKTKWHQFKNGQNLSETGGFMPTLKT